MSFFQLSFPALCQRTLGPICLILISAIGVAAQTDSTITGDIKDSNGAVLVGVQVTAKHIDTGLTRTTTSEDEGRFVFPGLPVGLYELQAEFAGFEPQGFPDVRLTVNETTAVSLVMKGAGLSAAVDVDSGEVLVKNTKVSRFLGESGNLQLRVEAFNLFNRANFAPPSLTASPARRITRLHLRPLAGSGRPSRHQGRFSLGLE